MWVVSLGRVGWVGDLVAGGGGVGGGLATQKNLKPHYFGPARPPKPAAPPGLFCFRGHRGTGDRLPPKKSVKKRLT